MPKLASTYLMIIDLKKGSQILRIVSSMFVDASCRTPIESIKPQSFRPNAPARSTLRAPHLLVLLAHPPALKRSLCRYAPNWSCNRSLYIAPHSDPPPPQGNSYRRNRQQYDTPHSHQTGSPQRPTRSGIWGNLYLLAQPLPASLRRHRSSDTPRAQHYLHCTQNARSPRL